MGEEVGEGAGLGEVVLLDGQGPERCEVVLGSGPESVVEIGDGVGVVDHALELPFFQRLRTLPDEAVSQLTQEIAGDVDVSATAEETDVKTVHVGIKEDLHESEVFLQVWMGQRAVLDFGEVGFEL